MSATVSRMVRYIAQFALLLLCVAAVLLPWRTAPVNICVKSDTSRARHVTLFTVDDLTYTQLKSMIDFQAGMSTPGITLVSPGLPRFPDPVANLYATLSAGDVINTTNANVGLLDQTIASQGASDRYTERRFYDVRVPANATVFSEALRQAVAENDKQLHTPSLRDYTIIVGVVPPQDRQGRWDSLTPMMILGSGAPTYTSLTTRRAGLVALRDIAPTILNLLGLRQPDEMLGSPAIGTMPPPSLVEMDTITQLNQQLIVPLIWALGLMALAVILLAVGLVANGRSASGLVGFLIRVTMALPLGMLIAPAILALLGSPAHPTGYGGVEYAVLIAALTFTVAASYGIRGIASLTAGVIVGDALTGTNLISRSVLSGYWLSGIRFYGIGNEYMGVLLAFGLLLPMLVSRVKEMNYVTPTSATISAKWGFGWLVWFAALVFVLSWPAYGAKAGGAVTAMVAFVPAWRLFAMGKRSGPWVYVASAIAGFALIFVWTAVENHLGAPKTHIQAAVGHLTSGDFRYIGHIAERKTKMAIKTALHPGMFVGLAGLAAAIVVWRRTRLRDVVLTRLAADPLFAEVARIGAWTIGACLLFNDSGVVAGVILLGALCLTFVNDVLAGGESKGSRALQ